MATCRIPRSHAQSEAIGLIQGKAASHFDTYVSRTFAAALPLQHLRLKSVAKSCEAVKICLCAWATPTTIMVTAVRPEGGICAEVCQQLGRRN